MTKKAEMRKYKNLKIPRTAFLKCSTARKKGQKGSKSQSSQQQRPLEILLVRINRNYRKMAFISRLLACTKTLR